MSERSSALAADFEAALKEFGEAIENCSDAQWRAVCGPEGWSVAQTAQHVAGQFPLEKEYIVAAAGGMPAPAYTWDDINGKNDRRAADNAACAKDEVLALLRRDGTAMAGYVRGLTDEQLDRTMALPLADGAHVSTQQLIEGGVLIDHVRGHLKSIRAVS